MSLPSIAEVEHADWPTLKSMSLAMGLNPKGRSDVVRWRVLEHVRRRTRSTPWKPDLRLQATLLTRLGFTEPAVRLWEPTIDLDAPAPWIGLGRAKLLDGDLEEAARAFDRAAQMGNAAAHLYQAETLAAGGKWEAAARACDAFLAARPRDLRGFLLKASFLARGGWADEAAAVLRATFEVHTDLPELWHGLGILLLKAGRPEAAAEAFREATRSDPRNGDAWVNRGVALLLQGRQRDAVGVLREALDVDPRHGVGLNDLGVAYLKNGQVKSAVVNLERAAKHLESPDVLLNLARAREAASERRAALDAYNRVLRLSPRDAEALAGRNRLAPPRRAVRARRTRVRPKRRKGPARSRRRTKRRSKAPAAKARGRSKPHARRRRVSRKPSRRPRTKSRRSRSR